MTSEFWKWLFGVLASSGLLGALAYLMREAVSKFFSKAVELRFEKRLETFKATIRDNETELSEIRSFLVSSRKERDSAFQTKRLEAAETLLRARFHLSKLSMLVEYMKILNTENLLKEGEDPKVADFIKTLIEPFEIDEKFKLIGSIDITIPRLYLSEKSLAVYDVYQTIIFSAAMMMKLYSIPISNKKDLLKAGTLRDSIVKLAPVAKEGFEIWGEQHAYYWSTHFHDEILRALRHEISGVDDMTRDAASIQKLALESRQAQISIRASLAQAGLPEDLLKSTDSPDEKAPATSGNS